MRDPEGVIAYIDNLLFRETAITDAIAAAREVRRRDEVDWPAWCFIPMSGWSGIFARGLGELPGERETLTAAVLATWRFGLGIYRFAAGVADSVAAAGDVLLQPPSFTTLPEWAVYIETPGAVFWGRRMEGFWSMLDWDLRLQETRLLLLPLFRGQKHEELLAFYAATLGAWTLGDYRRRMLEVTRRKAADHRHPLFVELNEFARNTSQLNRLVAQVRHVASADAAIRPAVGARDAPRRDSFLWPLPDKPRLWDVS